MTPGAKLRIGEVHALLRAEFPDIELSKIRYYEDKGLVHPSRSRKGYRLYSESDVACLREAFRLAREEFVPLKVVRQRLISQGLLNENGATPAAKEAALEATAPIVSLVVRREEAAEIRVDPATAPPRPPAVRGLPTPGVAASDPISEDELLRRVALSAAQLAALIDFGFLRPSVLGGTRRYEPGDVAIAEAAGVLLARGIEVRHLQAIKRTVDRETELVREFTAPLVQRSGVDAPQVRDATRAVADEIAALRQALVPRARRDTLGL